MTAIDGLGLHTKRIHRQDNLQFNILPLVKKVPMPRADIVGHGTSRKSPVKVLQR